MVVFCLRIQTGTQILIYFPVLLQISSVTSGQLLWEKHVKAPQWLMNPSPFTKRGIAADSQREKHMGMLAIAKAIPKVTVFYHITWQFWAPRGFRASRRMAAFWTVMENEQEVAWEGGVSCLLTSCGCCGAGRLGNCSLSWFPASAQFLLVAHIWERLRCDAWIYAGRRCQYWHGQEAHPERDRDSWLFASCLGRKRKDREQPSLSQGQLVLVWETFHLVHSHSWPSASVLKPTSQKSKRSDKKEGQSVLSCSQSVKLNCYQDTAFPFSSFDPWASYQG